MARFLEIILVITNYFILIRSQQLPSSQTQVLYQLRKQLEYPKELEVWNDTHVDFCYIPVTPFLMLTCEGNSVTELKIVGDKVASRPSKYGSYSVHEHTLSQSFSMDSFVTTLTRLTSLKVVILVSLGMWGTLPEKIHRLHSLEVLDLSSNYLYGTIPPRLSTLTMLNTVTLDGNYFNDTVPNWVSSLTNLTILSMKRNKLRGSLPDSIGSTKTLTTLSLSGNYLSGKIPDMSKLTNLEVLDMRDNNFESELPSLPTSLVTILLSNNSLSGQIPKQFGEMDRLQHLDLSFNKLEGIPPLKLFSLPSISYLNLESNILTGPLSSKLTCSGQLGYVDVSNNRLTGELPLCLSSNSNKRVVKYDGNCLGVDIQHQHDSNYCSYDGGGGLNVGILIAIIGGIIFMIVFVLVVVLMFCRKCCRKAMAEQSLLSKSLPETSASSFSSELLANARYISQATKYGGQVLPMHRVFSLEELREATKNFERASYIGEGSIGKLYKGRLENGTNVAIRCIALYKKYSIRNLKLRLDLLSKLRHPNLVCLVGHCIDSSPNDSSVNTVFLIYEHVPNGNLSAHLSDHSPEKILNWNDRLAVLIGISKAVHFLHTGIIPGFFNNRIRSSNILLDEHYIAKVSDYGLSVISEEIYKHEVKVKDKKGIQRKAATLEDINSDDDDIFSIGLIILEALVGPLLSEKGATFFLNDLDKLFSNQEEMKHIIDPIIASTCNQESRLTVISIMIKCLSPETSTRPSIEDVLWNLQYASQVQAQATSDGDVRSDVAS